jgi:uncharacterized protein (DUF4415 family)
VSRPVQYFTAEGLARGREMAAEEILDFLETFRQLQSQAAVPTRLISLKVPEDLLKTFRTRCELAGVRYQTQIKRLMREWIEGRRASRTG